MTQVYLDGENLPKVTNIWYLGVILSDDSSTSLDVERCCQSFFVQFNTMYYKFHKLKKNMLTFLSSTFCSSFYGIEIWYNIAKMPSKYNKLSVSYHKAIKKMCGLRNWDSNHDACENLGLQIFRHLLATRLFSFYMNISSTPSPCISHLKYYFKCGSYMYDWVKKLFADVYQIKDVNNNDRSAIFARINYIQRNEARSSHSYG